MAEQDSESVAPRAASVDGEQSAPELSSAESRESQDEEAAPRSAAENFLLCALRRLDAGRGPLLPLLRLGGRR